MIRYEHCIFRSGNSQTARLSFRIRCTIAVVATCVCASHCISDGSPIVDDINTDADTDTTRRTADDDDVVVDGIARDAGALAPRRPFVSLRLA